MLAGRLRTMSRRFPRHWTATRITGGWKVVDANGMAVACTCGDSSAKDAGSQSLSVEFIVA